MLPFSYSRPATTTEAVQAFIAKGAGTRFIAGGTTLYDLMKLNVERPRHLIDVTAIPGLDRIDTTGESLRFGALARMSSVASDPTVLRDYPVLAEGLAKAASQQLRNMASVGGNLLQRTRCIYFRNGAAGVSTGNVYPCNKREPGSGCAAMDGLDRGQAVLGTSANCNAVSPGDWPVALMAMDAEVTITGRQGDRMIPIRELYRLPEETPHREFAIEEGELITSITVPKTAAGRTSTYHKIRDRESYAFALASAAVALELEGDKVRSSRIALGGVATVPWRATTAEAFLKGRSLNRESAVEAGRVAFADARAGRDNRFKLELGARTVADALLIAAERNRS